MFQAKKKYESNEDRKMYREQWTDQTSQQKDSVFPAFINN